MKNISLLLLAIISLCISSCDDDIEDRPVIELSENVTLDGPFTGVYVLNVEDASNLAETFTWSGAVFTDNVVPTYSLEGDIAGNNFENAQVIGSTTETKLQVSVETLNTIAVALGIPHFEEGFIEVRLKTELGSASPVYSEEIYTLNVTPYSTELPLLYVPGGYQTASGYGGDWSPDVAPTLAVPDFGSTDFEGYVYFAADSEFKITDAPNWDNGIYGSDGADGLEFPGNDSGNLSTTAGYYRMNVDTEALTYTLTATSWGLVGDATGSWDVDQDMTYDADAKVWTITLDLVAGEIKFRANDAWDLNYGDDGADGSLEEGTANIPIGTAGNYTVTLDLSTPRAYTYTVIQN